jgi:hypothetical protein
MPLTDGEISLTINETLQPLQVKETKKKACEIWFSLMPNISSEENIAQTVC